MSKYDQTHYETIYEKQDSKMSHIIKTISKSKTLSHLLTNIC
jgi:hypothetical protein